MNKLEEVKGLFHRYIDEDLSLIEPIKERVVLLQELRKVYVAYDNEIQTLKAEKEEIFKEVKESGKTTEPNIPEPDKSADMGNNISTDKGNNISTDKEIDDILESKEEAITKERAEDI